MGPTEVARVTVQIGDHDIYSSSDGRHETRKVLRVIKHRGFSARTLVSRFKVKTCVTVSCASKRSVIMGSYFICNIPDGVITCIIEKILAQ